MAVLAPALIPNAPGNTCAILIFDESGKYEIVKLNSKHSVIIDLNDLVL